MQNVCDTKNAAFLAFEPGFAQRAVGKANHVAICVSLSVS